MIQNISISRTDDTIVLNLPVREARMVEKVMEKIANDYTEDCYEKDLASTIAKAIYKVRTKVGGLELP